MDERNHANEKEGRITVSERVRRITWSWFPCTMSTGALPSVLSQQPFQFTGLETIGKVVFIIDLILFVTFTGMIAARFLNNTRALPTSLHHQSESFFFGAWWVSAALILNCTTAYGIPGLADGKGWLIDVMFAFFWMYLGCAMLVAVLQYHIIFFAEKLNVNEAMPAWILPAYPFLVSGTLAANIAKTQADGRAVQLIIAGISGQGLGWMIALLMYTVYFLRLIKTDLPSPSVRPGMYVSVGPAAYTCAGLLLLGQGAQRVIPTGYMGITSLDVGDVWLAIALPAGLFLWMIAMWYSCLTTVSIVRELKKMHFSLQWWAFVFPNVGLVLATIQIGNILDSVPIQAVAAGLTLILVVLWFVTAFAHVRAIWRCDLLWPGKDAGIDNYVNSRDRRRSVEDDV